MITKEEKTRYQRQLILPGFGEEAQQRLKEATVFVAGAGGLGGPLSYYLAAAGVGTLRVADFDEVELSNLNRQILHSTNDIGTTKADSARSTLSKLNPEINIETYTVRINDTTIEKLAGDATIMVDCLDNIASRRVLNRWSIKNAIPIMHAGIDGWNGQLTLLLPPETACMNCLFSESKDTKEEKPVLGAVAGVMGTMQALETIKFIMGKSELKNKLLYFDGFTQEWTKLTIKKNSTCSVCGK